MKAVVCTRYGPPEVLRLAEVATPAPRENEVRLRILATADRAGVEVVQAAAAPEGHGALAVGGVVTEPEVAAAPGARGLLLRDRPVRLTRCPAAELGPSFRLSEQSVRRPSLREGRAGTRLLRSAITFHAVPRSG